MRKNTKIIAIIALAAFIISCISISINAGTGGPFRITGNSVIGFVGFCYNHQPVFDPYGPFNAREGELFTYDMNVSDPTQGIRPLWTDNASFFNISFDTGYISFNLPDTSDDRWVGIHPVYISFNDDIGCSNSMINTTIFFNITWMNHPPHITDFFPIGNYTITEEGSLYFNITFRDPDNENIFSYDDNNLSVRWWVDGTPIKNDALLTPRNWSEAVYHPDYNSSGLHLVWVEVDDGEFKDTLYWFINVTDVYVNLSIIQPEDKTSLLIFDNYSIFTNISVFENRPAVNCTATFNIYNKTIFDKMPYENYTHFIPYIPPYGSIIETWDIYTWYVGWSFINVTLDCEQGGYTYKDRFMLGVNATEMYQDIILPEGIHYNEPVSLPAYGNYLYSINFTFNNITTHSSKIFGCYINQSNCYDDLQPGCKQIFVNKSTIYGIAYYNATLEYKIKDDDIITSTLGNTTDNWIPWGVERCGIYYSNNMTPVFERNYTWRIHVHPIEWTTGDIANALNAKSAANQYLKNTIHSDDLGDVTFSVTKYGGTKVELVCNDGIDNPDESDTLVDCSDPECRGITFSCLPKQDFDNTSLFYSPSGSHGTLAPNIPPGDIASNQSSAATFNTQIEYTMHTRPDGNFKLRLRKWGISKTASFFIDGLPEIKTVDKYAPGDNADKGMMLYYLDNNGDPYGYDHLPQSKTSKNRIALRSYLSGGNEVQNLDTVINVTFANASAINMSEGYIVEITINYVEDSTPYEEKMNITVYFDDPSYGAPPRWTSDNQHEDEVSIDGSGWGPCNDTKNGDFDFLNCNSNEASCFDQSSYDCYDPDCNWLPGPFAWNDYAGINTTGLCGYYNESQNSSMCFDGYNNDWATEDTNWGHANTGLSLVDCRDWDCDNVSNGIWSCETGRERTCDDGYDNDMYNYYDCLINTDGSWDPDDAEYDCAGFCRATVDNDEVGPECDDIIDNDWDLYQEYGAIGYTYNNSYGAGMDCAWLTEHPDEDCNMTYLSSGFRCELGRELTCNDSFDNDFDLGHGQPEPGWYQSVYESTFNQTFDESSDYDDYDCQFAPLTPSSESNSPYWCFDNIDNDLDAYFWNNSWFINSSTGRDCADKDCIGVVNPMHNNQTCLLYEYNTSDPFFDGLPEPDLYCKNGFDDDADGPMDCYDSDCNKQFDMCLACPATENVTWDACADSFDNDYGVNIDCSDSDCINYLGDYDHHFCTSPGGENSTIYCTDGFDNDGDGDTDCADSDCIGESYCSFELCDDDIDNDGDGNTDCMDSNCANQEQCRITTDMSGTLISMQKKSAIFGNVNVTWDYIVKDGSNYTVNLFRDSGYSSASIYLGRLTGSALPVSAGLDNANFILSGPNASEFETSQYNEDIMSTKGQIELLDQVPSTPASGFNVTINIPTNNPMQKRTFEYYHSIDGIPSLGNMVDVIIIDKVKPVINMVISEPTDKNNIKYGGSVWVGVNVSDQDIGNYNDGTIDRCYWTVSGPGYYQSGEDSDDCRFEFTNITEDGNYALSIWARDDNGNYADPQNRNYQIKVIPEYIEGSFTLADRWYTTGDAVNITAQFHANDAGSISTCSIWYSNSTGSALFIKNVTPSNSGNTLTCPLTNITAPTADEMYEIWINITDTKGNHISSGPETFFICNDPLSQGTGSNSEKWSCVFADVNEDGTIDSCEQKEYDITLKKHALPDPIWVGGDYLNYTITLMNRGYGTAKNVTIIDTLSNNLTFINASPMPTTGGNTWYIGPLGMDENRSIEIITYTMGWMPRGTIIINKLNMTYVNSSNDTVLIPLEINTTVIGNTPPIFTAPLPRMHEIYVGEETKLPFNLDDYVFDPDIPFGDYLVYDYIIKNNEKKIKIRIAPDGKIYVEGIKTGASIVNFIVTDSWGEYNTSTEALLVVKDRAHHGGGGGCIENWKCKQWSQCGENRMRYRTCVDKNHCGSERNKPIEIEFCEESEPKFCYDKKRDVGECGIDCGGLCGMDCCNNGYWDKNLGEEGIDCGGNCKKCPEKEKPAPIEFNDMLGVLVTLILLLIVMLIPKLMHAFLKDEEYKTKVYIKLTPETIIRLESREEFTGEIDVIIAMESFDEGLEKIGSWTNPQIEDIREKYSEIIGKGND